MEREPSWLNAQTLTERRDALRRLKVKPRFDRRAAAGRLKAWRAGRALQDEKIFRRRLAVDDLTKEEFLRILGTPPERIFGPDFTPPWLAEVLRSESEGAELPFKSPVFAHYERRGILAPYLPMIRRYAKKLHEHLSNRGDLRAALAISVDEVLDLILAPALQRIEYYHRSAAILEVNIQRVLEQLKGGTPEERFDHFKQKMRDPKERARVQKKYPVLTRALQKTLEFWLANNVEFFERLHEDLEEIRSAFGVEEGDELAKVDPGSGDLHRQGRSVTIVTFKSGKKILYKPRNLDIDLHFHRLMEWCRGAGMDPPVRAVKVIAREDYGWVEFIVNRPASGAEEHDEFYRRLGGAIAVLHALSAVDIHFENIVACGPDPYVIDMETLFHVNLDELVVRCASDLLARRYRDSVMAIGILPTPVLSGEGKKTFDTSAIGASVDQQAPYQVLGMVNLGRDDVALSHIPGWIPSVHNRPSEDATRPIPAEKILSGFEDAYRFLAARKKDLLGPGGPVAAFGRLRGRMIARNTRYYGSLFLEAIHPDFLRDALDMAAHWDDVWNDVVERPKVEKFIPSEYAQLGDGDIPFFTAGLADARRAVGADGRRISGIGVASGFERAKRTILAMSEENMGSQSWLIRAALGGTESYVDRPIKRANPASDLEAAADIGRSVLSRLGRFKDMASSYHVVALGGEGDGPTGAYTIGTSGADLYEGNGGIALFLAYLGRETGDKAFTAAARGLSSDMLHVLRGRDRRWNNLSGFLGAPSLAYVLAHLAALWKDPKLAAEAHRIASSVLRIRPDETNLDLLLGPAGCALAVLPLARRGGDVMTLARRSADYLLERSGGEKRWMKLPVKRGFSHGLAGVAYAFSELAAATKNAAYSREAAEMLVREREFLAGGHWTDAHNYRGHPQVSWCHGAVGIALGRLGMYRRAKSDELRRDIEEALEETAKHHWMDSHCLCHGSMGNLEPLLVASEFPEFARWTKDLNERAGAVRADLIARGWRSVMASQTLSIDLFTGLSGAGYGFLRLHAPGRVPSVMLLEPPTDLRNP